VKPLTRLFYDSELYVQNSAIVAVGKIGPGAQDAREPLIGLIKGSSYARCRLIAEVLVEIAPTGPAVIDALMTCLGNGDKHEFDSPVSLALGKAGRAAVPRLVEALKDRTVNRLRWNAVYALGNIGPDAQDAIPQLMVEFKGGPDLRFGDRDSQADLDFRFTVALSLSRIGPAATEALIAATRPGNTPVVQSYSTVALTKIQPRSKVVLQRLIELLAEENARPLPFATVLIDAARGLSAYGAEAKAAVPHLIRMFKQSGILGRDCRDAAAHALLAIDPEAARQAGMTVESKR
jgi:HEAT repeat protein